MIGVTSCRLKLTNRIIFSNITTDLSWRSRSYSSCLKEAGITYLSRQPNFIPVFFFFFFCVGQRLPSSCILCGQCVSGLSILDCPHRFSLTLVFLGINQQEQTILCQLKTYRMKVICTT